jgi:hypothetical protein
MKSSRPPPACDHEPMDVAVHWVRTYWTRRSRGAPGAIRRSALPEAFPLPDAAPPFVHEVRMSERDDFTPHSTVTNGLPSSTEVELTEANGLLHVLLVAQHAPEWASNGLDLAWRPAAVPLRPRQALRWQINHRFRAERGWYYRLDTLNVSYGKSSAEVFLHPPTRRIDERAQLP